jgi:hypothetical protein
MAPRKINARDIVVEVFIPDPTTPTWVEVGGLTTATPNPSENEESTDTTTFESLGEYEQEIMQRGATLKLEGFMIKDDATGALDAGQARCEELGALVGVESLGKVRFRHPVDANWKVWSATFSIGEQGGGNNDKAAWSCTMTRSGASTTVAV